VEQLHSKWKKDLSELIGRIWSYFEEILNPGEILLVIFGMLLVAIFNPLDILGSLEIGGFVETHRPWFVFGLFASFILVILRVLNFFLNKFSNWKTRRQEAAGIRGLKLTYEGQIILWFVDHFEPDETYLYRSSPFVRELRRSKLVRLGRWEKYSDMVPVILTELGRKKLTYVDMAEFHSRAEGDQLEFLRSVVGGDLSILAVGDFDPSRR
jgi:hypothetical protein